YLWRQYKTISIIVVIFTVLLAVTIRSPTNTWLGVDTAVGFLLGALCSNLAGYIAMYISVRSNVRSAKGAMTSLDRALKIAFRGGVVFGLAVVSLSLLGISSLFLILAVIFILLLDLVSARASQLSSRSWVVEFSRKQLT